MPTVPVRKARAGSDSWGHVWPKDGAVAEVDYDEAMVLLAIPDGGFSIADQPGDKPTPEPEPEPEVSEPDPAQGELSELDPKPDDATDKPPAKKTAARRRTAQS